MDTRPEHETPWKQFGTRIYGPDEITGHDSDTTDYRALIATCASADIAERIVQAVNRYEGNQ